MAVWFYRVIPVWDGDGRRQFGQWHGVQSFVGVGQRAGADTGYISFRSQCCLTWPTNATGYTLQSTTNLVSTTVWSNVSPAAVVVNGQNAVTNPISGTKKFYRLSQP
jgi:hypothetical protein